MCDSHTNIRNVILVLNTKIAFFKRNVIFSGTDSAYFEYSSGVLTVKTGTTIDSTTAFSYTLTLTATTEGSSADGTATLTVDVRATCDSGAAQFTAGLGIIFLALMPLLFIWVDIFCKQKYIIIYSENMQALKLMLWHIDVFWCSVKHYQSYGTYDVLTPVSCVAAIMIKMLVNGTRSLICIWYCNLKWTHFDLGNIDTRRGLC